MEKLFHLKDDLGINKLSVRKSYENDGEHLPENEHTERGFDRVRDLLNKRTQLYNREDSEVLVDCYMSSHDFCVLDNSDDFSSIEVYQAEQKWERYKSALDKLKSVSV